jgi:2-iminobutanoate/2-iminopropanoate deaminase
MSFKVITGANLPATNLPFSAAIEAGGFVFVSGQASVGDDGKIISDTFANEMHRTFANLKRILDAAGLDFSDIVQVRSYVKNPQDLPEYNTLYREYFKEPYPARTTLVACLGTVLYEVDVIAYRATAKTS